MRFPMDVFHHANNYHKHACVQVIGAGALALQLLWGCLSLCYCMWTGEWGMWLQPLAGDNCLPVPCSCCKAWALV